MFETFLESVPLLKSLEVKFIDYDSLHGGFRAAVKTVLLLRFPHKLFSFCVCRYSVTFS